MSREHLAALVYQAQEALKVLLDFRVRLDFLESTARKAVKVHVEGMALPAWMVSPGDRGTKGKEAPGGRRENQGGTGVHRDLRGHLDLQGSSSFRTVKEDKDLLELVGNRAHLAFLAGQDFRAQWDPRGIGANKANQDFPVRARKESQAWFWLQMEAPFTQV